MMRSILTAVVVLLVLHVLAGAGLAAWLGVTGRLSRERVVAAAAMFGPTVEAERRREEEAQRLAQSVRDDAANAARLEAVADGPMTLGQRLAQRQEADALAVARAERVRREVADLRAQIAAAKDALAKQQAELDEARKALKIRENRQDELARDEGFQQTVAMYERLRARQVKGMFQTLIADGQESDVLDYLAAMQGRKSAAVLKEFKSPEEAAQAARLLQGLRERGVEVEESAASADSSPPASTTASPFQPEPS